MSDQEYYADLGAGNLVGPFSSTSELIHYMGHYYSLIPYKIIINPEESEWTSLQY